jgi:peptide deformylase
MPILKIETGQNNPILRKKSLEIKEVNYDIRKLAENMIEIMIKNNGVGLAAPQIGKNIRLFVVHPTLSKKTVFINPEISKISKKTDVAEEGCLSLPGMFIKKERAKSLKVKAADENGKEFKLKTEDLLARVIQHEIDHLNGILIIDHE